MKKRNLVSTFVRKQMTTVFFFSLNSDSADDYNNERKLGLENFVKTSLAKKKTTIELSFLSILKRILKVNLGGYLE